MNSNIEIELNRLRANISELESAIDGFSRTAYKGYEAMKGLSTTWEGGAHDVFTKQLDIDYEMVKSMEETMKYMLECLKYAAEEYSKCENEVYSKVNSMVI